MSALSGSSAEGSRSSSNFSAAQTRHENNQLEAVISLPSGVFKPYARVSTAILLFTKTNSGGTDQAINADGRALNRRGRMSPRPIARLQRTAMPHAW